MAGFNSILDTGKVEDTIMTKDKQFGSIVSKFKVKSVKMMLVVLNSPAVRQALSHWGYELLKDDMI